MIYCKGNCFSAQEEELEETAEKIKGLNEESIALTSERNALNAILNREAQTPLRRPIVPRSGRMVTKIVQKSSNDTFNDNEKVSAEPKVSLSRGSNQETPKVKPKVKTVFPRGLIGIHGNEFAENKAPNSQSNYEPQYQDDTDTDLRTTPIDGRHLSPLDTERTSKIMKQLGPKY